MTEKSMPVITEELTTAIRRLTDTLDYEWSGDFRAEIEALNNAHLRAIIEHRRKLKNAGENQLPSV